MYADPFLLYYYLLGLRKFSWIFSISDFRPIRTIRPGVSFSSFPNPFCTRFRFISLSFSSAVSTSFYFAAKFSLTDQRDAVRDLSWFVLTSELFLEVKIVWSVSIFVNPSLSSLQFESWIAVYYSAQLFKIGVRVYLFVNFGDFKCSVGRISRLLNCACGCSGWSVAIFHWLIDQSS